MGLVCPLVEGPRNRTCEADLDRACLSHHPKPYSRTSNMGDFLLRPDILGPEAVDT